MNTKAILLLTTMWVGCTSADQMDPMPGETCSPWTCEQANASCGTIDDGCGGDLDCGQCTDQDGQCPPTTCAFQNAQCGTIPDACGGTLSCGECDDAQCIDGRCVQTNCGTIAENACGGCEPLPVEPGTACPIEGTAACNQFGMVGCTSTAWSLAATDDADDSWRVLDGALQTLGSNGWDEDAGSVDVDDTFWGLLQPEFEYTHTFVTGSSPVRVCAITNRKVDSTWEYLPAQCADEPINLDNFLSSGCCKDVMPSQPGVNFKIKLALGVPNPGDDDMRVDLSVRTLGQPSSPIAMKYQFRYRF